MSQGNVWINKRRGGFKLFGPPAAPPVGGTLYDSGSTGTSLTYFAAYQADFPTVLVAAFTTPPPGASLFNAGSNVTLSSGNRVASFAGTGSALGGADGLSGAQPSAWEFTVGGGATAYGYLNDPTGADPEQFMYGFPNDAVYYDVSGFMSVNGVVTPGPALVDGDILGFVLDYGSNLVEIYINGVDFGGGFPTIFGFGPYGPIASRA